MLRTPAPLIGALGLMYKDASTFRPPSRSPQQLWRYLPADRLKDILKSGEIYFRRITSLEDAREGTLTTRTRNQLAAQFQSQQALSVAAAHAEVDVYLKVQENLYVNCWHMNDHESYLMWRAYANRGYAILTTFERLRASFSTSPGVVNGGVVQYLDFNRDISSFGNIFRHAVIKDMPYKDEQEFRLVLWTVDPENHEMVKSGEGVRVPVDVQMLIASLIHNPLGIDHDPELEELILRKHINVKSSAVAIRDPQ